MITLNGKETNGKRAKDLIKKIESLSVIPHLVIVQVGDRSESNVYVGQKVLFGEKIGAKVTVHKLEESVTKEDIVSDIEKFNSDDSVHGIILQLPVSESLDLETILNTIKPEKDVDGLSATNIRRLATNNKDGLVPATAKGVITLLDEYDIELEGKNVVIVGRSLLVGKAVALLFSNRDATVTLCHSKTKDLASFTKKADILVVAVGRPGLITKEHVNENQVIVDVGITSTGDRQLKGDVADDVKDHVYAISPVPGGVGPMTVLSLFENLLKNL